MDDTKDLSDGRWKDRLTLALRWFQMASQFPAIMPRARNLSLTDHRIIWFLVSGSWACRSRAGTGKMEGSAAVAVSAAEIAREIGADQSGVARSLRDLAARNVLLKTPTGELGINPYYAAWEGCWKPEDLTYLHRLFEAWVGPPSRTTVQDHRPTLGQASRTTVQDGRPGPPSRTGVQESRTGVQESRTGVQESRTGVLPPSYARAGELGELGEGGEGDPPTKTQKQNGQTDPPWYGDL